MGGSGIIGERMAVRIDWYYLQPVGQDNMSVNGCGNVAVAGWQWLGGSGGYWGLWG
jgi:hypothetical protein